VAVRLLCMRRRWGGSVGFDWLLTDGSGRTGKSDEEMPNVLEACLRGTRCGGREGGKRPQIVSVENIVDVSVMITLAGRSVVGSPVTIDDKLVVPLAISIRVAVNARS